MMPRVDPRIMGRVHLGLAVFFVVPMFPITVWIVFNLPSEWSIVLLQFYSLWALSATHWGAWQATRAERKAGGLDDSSA